MLQSLLGACCTCSIVLGAPPVPGSSGDRVAEPHSWVSFLLAERALTSPTSSWETPWTCTWPCTQTMCSTSCSRPGYTSTWESGQKRYWALRAMFWGRLSTINTGLLIFGLSQPALQSATSCICNECSWRSSHIAGNQFEAGRVDDSCLLVPGKAWEQPWVIIYDLQLVLQPRLWYVSYKSILFVLC